MLYLTCTTITSVDLAHYGVSRAKDWVSGDCGTMSKCMLSREREWDKHPPERLKSIEQGSSRSKKPTSMIIKFVYYYYFFFLLKSLI